MHITHTLFAMMLFALVTSVTPGPVNIICAMSGARYGVLRSLSYVLGATISFVVILICMGVGIGFLLNMIDAYSWLLLLFGSAYMLYLAYKIALAPADVNVSGDETSCPGFLSGILIQAANPKAWLVALSAVTVYVIPYSERNWYLTIFSLIFLLMCFLSLTLWVYMGRRVAKVAGNFSVFNKIMAVLLVVSVLMMLFEEFYR